MGPLLALLLVQDPLGADDIETREQAALELRRRGEPALPEIRRRITEAVDPEVRARLQDVVAHLEADARRRTFGGGNEVGELRARLVRLDKPPEGRLPFRLEIMNVGLAPRPFVPIEVLDESLPGLNSSASGAHARIDIRRLDDRPRNGGTYRYTCGGGRSTKPVFLRPGECRRFDDLPEERLAPGRYEASVRYYAKHLPGAAEDLVSDTVRFEIKD